MRTFTLTAGTSDKFWSIGVEGADVTVHYGRNGTKGQVTRKTYADPAAAAAEAAKQVAAKEKKGYVEGAATTGTALPAPRPPAVPDPPAPAVPDPGTSSVPSAPTHGGDDVRPDAAPDAAPVAAPDATPATAPADLGVLLTRTEEAALPVGRPLDSLEVPEPPRDGPATAKHWEAWQRANAVVDTSYYARIETYLLPPVDGVPDRRTAAWWVAFECDRVPQIAVDSRWVPLTWEQWAAQEAAERSRVTAMDLDLPERRRRARAAASDPDAPLPPRAWVGHDLPDGLRVAAWIALGGLAAAFDVDAAVAGDLRAGDVPALRALVVPQLAPADVERLRAAARSPETPLRTRVVLSALVAEPDEHAALVAAVGPDAVVEQRPPRTLASGRSVGADVGLHDAVLVAAAVALPDAESRAELWDGVVDLLTSLGETEQLRGRRPPGALELELFGTRALAVAVDRVCAETNAERANFETRPLLARLSGAGAVPFVLRLATDSKAVVAAREWLVAHAGALAAYDGPLSRGQLRALESVVREVLATAPGALAVALADARHPDVAALVARVGDEAALPVLGADGGLPAWWNDATAAEEATPVPDGPLKLPARLPAYAAALPPLRVADARLDDEQVAAVLWSALRSARDETLAPRPLVAAVRERMSGPARDAIGLGLLEGYLGAGAKAPDKAVFLAAGFLGADGLVLELAPRVRAWPGESQHQRAVTGLDVLAATGTTSALQAISGIAAKSKFKGVQKAAQESLARLAALQGLTVDELEDRVVPDGGLDERGVRVLDFGPRRFRVALSPQGGLVVTALDADGRPTGRPRTALPAPNAGDDADLAAAAKAEFTLARKQLSDLAKIQTVRLEKAMVTGRRWPVADHRAYVVEHPVLNSLVRPLVWAVEPGQAGPAGSGGAPVLVRVTEDREYLTIDEEPYDAPDGATVTLAHPLHLADDVRDAWRAHLADYELVAPVDQLDRATFGLPDGQRPGSDFAGLPQGRINPGTLVSTLERMGWVRGTPADAGVIGTLSLPFPDRGLEVVVEIRDGLWTGMIHESGPQEVTEAGVFALGGGARWYYDTRGAHDWTTVDPIVVSEVRRAFAALQEKVEG
ncbi:DUF4132 domain-containing protein [Nocardioides sp. CPCC 205120]|uniref:DUF4132 domain-containing protein n=1 Tax=Nocardioides sp. CPCC 205120 TaxID=3406462 RepID=UPI003B509CBE